MANSRFAGFDEAPALLMLLRFWNDVRRVGPLLAKDILESATAAFSFPSEKELEDFAPDEDPAPTVALAAPTNTASPELVGTLTENVVVVEEEAAEGRGDPEDAEAGEDAAEAGEDAAADDDDDDDEEAEEEEEEDGEDDEEADGEEDDEVDHEADEYGEAVDDDYEAADGNYDDEQADASDDDMELVPRPQKKQHRAEGRGVTWREPISDVGPQGPNRERLMTSTPRTPPRTRSGRLGPASQYVRASVVPPHLLPTQDVSTAAA